MEQEHTVCFHVILEKALVFTVDRKELAIKIEKVLAAGCQDLLRARLTASTPERSPNWSADNQPRQQRAAAKRKPELFL
jgi:hypothetical protein